jgi:hypothetical protein
MDTDQLEHHVRETITEILEVLHSRGINQISVGGLLRIMGVPNHMATRHDLDYIEITDQVDLDALYINSRMPPGTQLQ